MTRALPEDLQIVREMSLSAGTLLLESMGKVGRVRQKTGTELLTDLDKRVEDHLIETLSRVFPGDKVVAEESGITEGTGGRTWYIDPLDGTTNYAHGHPFFSVSIACADDEGLLLGAVFAPYLDELYLARRGNGASLERPRHATGRDLTAPAVVGVEQALLATGFPYQRDEKVDRNTTHVANFLKAGCHGVRRGGSAAIDLAHVAAGTVDGYWEMSLRPWDSAAGTLIAREAGALVTDFAGVADRLHYETVLAAAPGLHTEMVAMLARPFVRPGGEA